MLRTILQTILALALLLLTPPPATAQDLSELECSSDDIESCLQIAFAYAQGSAPFPQDESRMEHFARQTLTLSRKGCMAGRVQDCEMLGKFVLFARNFGSTFETEAYFNAELLTLIMDQTSSQCFSGHSGACRMAGDANMHLSSTTTPDDNEFQQGLMVEMAALRTHRVHLMHSAIVDFRACAEGDKASCADVFDRQLIPLERDADLVRLSAAIKYCATGDSVWCRRLGSVALMTKARVGGPDTAITDALNELCTGGVGEACYQSALHTSEPNERLKYQELACRAGESRSCHFVFGRTNYLYEETGDPAARQKTSEMLALACDNQADLYSCLFREHLNEE